MTVVPPPGDDVGGDPACWARLFDGTDDRPLGATTWASLVHGLADAVIVADRTGTITYWNVAAERVFGWLAPEAVGRSLDLIIPARFRARHWEGYDHVVATGVTRYGDDLLEVPALHRDGHQLSIAFTVTLLADPDGQVTRLVAVVRDDTEGWHERRRIRTELAELRSTPEPEDPTAVDGRGDGPHG